MDCIVDRVLFERQKLHFGTLSDIGWNQFTLLSQIPSSLYLNVRILGFSEERRLTDSPGLRC
jgi:hypothetical protein